MDVARIGSAAGVVAAVFPSSGHRYQALRPEEGGAEPKHLKERDWANAGCFERTKRVVLFCVLTAGLASVDIISDILSNASFWSDGYIVFGALGSMLIIANPACCWIFLKSQGVREASFLKFLFGVTIWEDAFEALKTGHASFGMAFIALSECSIEGFQQALLNQYGLLIGLLQASGGKLFGVLPKMTVVAFSNAISFMAMAKTLATFDFYGETHTTLFQRGARMLVRLVEVALRSLALAFFGALLRPEGAGMHENVNWHLPVICGVGFMANYTICNIYLPRLELVPLWAAMFFVGSPPKCFRIFDCVRWPLLVVRSMEAAVMAALVSWQVDDPVGRIWRAPCCLGAFFVGALALLPVALAIEVASNAMAAPGSECHYVAGAPRSNSRSLARQQVLEAGAAEATFEGGAGRGSSSSSSSSSCSSSSASPWRVCSGWTSCGAGGAAEQEAAEVSGALFAAVSEGDHVMTRLLAKMVGPAVDAIGSDGRSAIECARSWKVVKALADGGASLVSRGALQRLREAAAARDLQAIAVYVTHYISKFNLTPEFWCHKLDPAEATGNIAFVDKLFFDQLTGVSLTSWECWATILPACSGLKELTLCGCGLDDASSSVLGPAIAKVPGLEKLSLSKNSKIRARGWAAWAEAIGQLNALEHIDFRACGLDDSSSCALARAVAHLHQTNTLKVLQLSCNEGIGRVGQRAWAEAFPGYMMEEYPSGGSKVHHFLSDQYVSPMMWCVTYADLVEIEADIRASWKEGEIPDSDQSPNPHHDDPLVGPNVYQVVKHYIKPRGISAGNKSWALAKHRAGLPCDVFVSHVWSEGIFESLHKILTWWPRGAKHAYICFLSNPQSEADLEICLRDNPLASPFTRSLDSARTVLVLPTRTCAMYTRLWCAFEAYLAGQATKVRDITLTLPLGVRRVEVLRVAAPGLCLLFLSALLGDQVAAPAFGHLLGPAMWLLLSFSAGSAISTALQWAADGWNCSSSSSSSSNCCSTAACYAELSLVGVSAGIALRELRGGEDSWAAVWAGRSAPRDLRGAQRFAPGEGAGCFTLFLCIMAYYVYHIYVLLIRRSLDNEARQLDFDTVRNAKASNPRDNTLLKAAMRGHEDEVDAMIRLLCRLGHFNAAARRNIELGMSVARVRDGINPFKVALAVSCWQFWWVSDLAARGRPLQSFLLPACTTALAWVMVYRIGNLLIAAIDAALWCSVGFAALSNHSAFFNRANVAGLKMSEATLILQMLSWAATVLGCVYFYAGFQATARRTFADVVAAKSR